MFRFFIVMGVYTVFLPAAMAQNSTVTRASMLENLLNEYNAEEAASSIACLGVTPEKYKAVYRQSVQGCTSVLPATMKIGNYGELEDWLDTCLVKFYRRDMGVSKQIFDGCLAHYNAENP